MAGQSITIGSWSSSGVDGNGVRWITRAITGLADPPSAVSMFRQRPQADGAFGSSVREAPRMVSWIVLINAPNRAARDEARHQLMRLTWKLREATVCIWHTGSATYQFTAQRDGKPDIEFLSPTAFRFQQHVICADPFFYGPPRVQHTGLPVVGGGLRWPMFDPAGWLDWGVGGVSGQVTLENRGSADAWPQFEVLGDLLGGVEITCVENGRRIVFGDDLPTDQDALFIDSRTGRVELNQSDVSQDLLVSEWSSVPPGETRTFQFAAVGSASQGGVLTARIIDTYI